MKISIRKKLTKVDKMQWTEINGKNIKLIILKIPNIIYLLDIYSLPKYPPVHQTLTDPPSNP